MTAAAVMTFATLQTDIIGYAERQDVNFTTQIPRFIMMAESRIASEARGLGYLRSVTDTLVPNSANGQQLQKPSRWRETASLTIGKGTNFATRKALLQRGYEYCRMYSPDPTQYAEPKFYADWDWGHALIVPTPDLAYPFEWLYHERPQPLDDSNTTNWTTQYAPQLILYATLLECQHWIKRQERVQEFQEEYDRALKQVEFEGKRQLSDRTANRVNPDA